MWRPTKEEIRQWLEAKSTSFPEIRIRTHRISSEQWLQRYVFTDLHEIFFVDFPNVLAEWLQRLAEKNGTFCTVFQELDP
jgi:hypothetical protein